MPIPTTRHELTEQVTDTYARLRGELRDAKEGLADAVCVDEWTVKDVVAVRVWWTEQVIEWIEAGRRGETPELPAPGYRWNETPRLNADLVSAAASEPYEHVVERLDRGVERVLATIDSLDDRALLEPAVFPWAGKWPLIRWISINTARQYTTARAYVRKAKRSHG